MKSTFPILTTAIFISLLAGSNAAPQPTPADTPPPVVTKDPLDVELSTLNEDAYQEQYDFLIPVPEFENQTYPWYRPYHHRGPYIPSKTKTEPEFDQVHPDGGEPPFLWTISTLEKDKRGHKDLSLIDPRSEYLKA